MFFKKSDVISEYNKLYDTIKKYLESDNGNNLDDYQVVIDFYCTGNIEESIQRAKVYNPNCFEAIYYVYFTDLQYCREILRKSYDENMQQRMEADESVLNDLKDKRNAFFIIEGYLQRMRKLERRIPPEQSKMAELEELLHLDRLKKEKQV